MSRFVHPQTSAMVVPGSLAGDAKPACALDPRHGPGRFALPGASLDPPTGCKPPAAPVGPDALATFHVLTYAEWVGGGRTHCCQRLVTDLPRTDACGGRWAYREPGQTRCNGRAVTR